MPAKSIIRIIWYGHIVTFLGILYGIIRTVVVLYRTKCQSTVLQIIEQVSFKPEYLAISIFFGCIISALIPWTSVKTWVKTSMMKFFSILAFCFLAVNRLHRLLLSESYSIDIITCQLLGFVVSLMFFYLHVLKDDAEYYKEFKTFSA
jgi:hypothetical protein